MCKRLLGDLSAKIRDQDIKRMGFDPPMYQHESVLLQWENSVLWGTSCFNIHPSRKMWFPPTSILFYKRKSCETFWIGWRGDCADKLKFKTLSKYILIKWDYTEKNIFLSFKIPSFSTRPRSFHLALVYLVIINFSYLYEITFHTHFQWSNRTAIFFKMYKVIFCADY